MNKKDLVWHIEDVLVYSSKLAVRCAFIGMGVGIGYQIFMFIATR